MEADYSVSRAPQALSIGFFTYFVLVAASWRNLAAVSLLGSDMLDVCMSNGESCTCAEAIAGAGATSPPPLHHPRR